MQFAPPPLPLNVVTAEAMSAVSASAAVVTPMHNMLYGLCDSMGVKFLEAGKPVLHSDVLGPSALLPMVAWISQDAGRRLLNADFGCLLHKPSENDSTLLGVHCVVPPVTGHIADVTRALFFAHFTVEIFGLRHGALIDVMHLSRMFRENAPWKEIFATHSADLQKGEMT